MAGIKTYSFKLKTTLFISQPDIILLSRMSVTVDYLSSLESDTGSTVLEIALSI